MEQRDEIYNIFEHTLNAIVNESSSIIDSFLPQRADISDDCQMLTLRNAVHELDHAVSGTEVKDMRAVSDDEKTELEEEWKCEPFSKDIAIDSISDLINQLQDAREMLRDL